MKLALLPTSGSDGRRTLPPQGRTDGRPVIACGECRNALERGAAALPLIGVVCDKGIGVGGWVGGDFLPLSPTADDKLQPVLPRNTFSSTSTYTQLRLVTRSLLLPDRPAAADRPSEQTESERGVTYAFFLLNSGKIDLAKNMGLHGARRR